MVWPLWLMAMTQMVAAATQRGEIAALVDTLDRLDVASAAAAGVDLSRLLWIRGQEIAGRVGPSGPTERETGDGRPIPSSIARSKH